MLELIYGPHGSGKTRLVAERIRSDLINGMEVLLVVPDQEVLEAEALLSAVTEDIDSHRLGIYSFSRLCDLVFRKYGSLSYKSVDKTVGKLITFLAVNSVSSELIEYGRVSLSDTRLIADIYETVKQLKAYNITHSTLSRAAESDAVPEGLKNKLCDISAILAGYDAVLRTGYDDPTEDLNKLNRLCLENPVFAGYSIYIDSFVSFTPAQAQIVQRMAEGCERLTVTLAAPFPEYGRPDAVAPVYDTEAKLLSICNKRGITPRITKTNELYRYKNEGLKALAQGLLWGKEAKCTEEIRLFACPTVYDEARLVAMDIAKGVREGKRYRDFSVIVRKSENYRGIIDAAFEKYGIPYFISAPSDIRQAAPVRLVTAALNVAVRGFLRRDVLTYLKTGLTGIPEDMADLFEDYICRHKISGRELISFEPFTLSPYSYGLAVTETELAILDKVNCAKDALITPLYDFYTALKGAVRARDISRCLFTHLNDIGLWDRIEELKKDAVFYGDTAYALELDQLHQALIDAAEKLSDITDSVEMDPETYLGLFDMILSETEIGTIPTCCDQVVIGEAQTLRTSEIKHAYIIGLNEGEFPMAAEDGGIFKDSDKKLLSEMGIELMADTVKASERELYDFYRAAVSPKESLTMTYHCSDLRGAERRPSYAVDRVREVLPDIKARPMADSGDAVQNKATALEEYAKRPDGAIGRAVEELFSGDKEFERIKEAVRTPIISKNEALTENVAGRAFPEHLALTPSRLDLYGKCEFSYCCRYILKLKESDEINFEASDFGNFVHYIMKALIDDCIKEPDRVNVSDGELTELIAKYSGDYIRTTLGCDIDGVKSGRLRAAFKRLIKAAAVPCRQALDEIREGAFFPLYTEVPILAYRGGNGIPALTLALPDGTDCCLVGVVDRVDLMEKDGKKYIKLVDYKTGRVDFRPEKLPELEGIQLMLYMLSVTSPNSGQRLIPAALYYMETVPRRDEEKSSADIQEGTELKRSGAAVCEYDILSGLQAGLTDSGSERFSARAGHITFASTEEMENMFQSVISAVSDAAMRMRQGSARANAKGGRQSPCQYCPYIEICRNTAAAREDQ